MRSISMTLKMYCKSTKYTENPGALMGYMSEAKRSRRGKSSCITEYVGLVPTWVPMGSHVRDRRHATSKRQCVRKETIIGRNIGTSV